MTQEQEEEEEEEISASALYHWASSKEAELVELPCFSVITQRALGQICVADTNAFPLLALCLHTRTHTASQRSAMCLQYGRSWSRGLCVFLHLRGNGTLGRLSVGIVLPLPYISLCSLWCLDILFNHSDFVLFFLKEKKNELESWVVITVWEHLKYLISIFCVSTALWVLVFIQHWAAHRNMWGINLGLISRKACESIFAQ